MKKVCEIANILSASSSNLDSLSLLTGKAGVAVFLYQYWLVSKQYQYYEKALELLSECITSCCQKKISYSFCNGVAGIGWCLKYFEENKVIDGNVQEIIDMLFPNMYIQMVDFMKAGKYDFLHEALGIALCCYKNKADRRFIDDFLNEMIRVSLRGDNGIFWNSTVYENGVLHKVINLSMSHGLSGIICCLCKIGKSELARYLVGESVKFLVDQRQDNTIYSSCFPSIISEKVNYRNGRLSWCYGDLGVVVALLQASCVLNNTDYRNMALNVIKICSHRRDTKKEFVLDAGICHGSAGIAHIFNRVYQKTGDPELKDAALYWLDDCLQKASFIDGLAGYKVWRRDGWLTKSGLLEGIAGIGLVLLAAISSIEPNWDECLLLS